ncbi:DUF6586 family protein [Lunatibacter salilacus]|uniref:DUF6586 family protein n=1 Tax=Lunatibacter salilacus TaxID=2483804 RepID=UPI00131A6B64|nr:DUF6586 family protein [Lunatibacter salilacus]
MKKYSVLKELTDSKLRYAQIYLDELKKSEILGSDIEKAHSESFLFHLKGVVDAFLAEINEIYGLGIKAKKLSIESLKDAKSNSKKPIQEVKKLSKLMGKKNWLYELKSFNLNAVPKIEKSKKSTGKVKFESGNLLEQIGQVESNPNLEKFEEWQNKMRKLILELRESAIFSAGKSSKKK